MDATDPSKVQNETITIECEKCGAAMSKSVADLRANNQIQCQCGNKFEIDMAPFERHMRELKSDTER